LNPKSQTVEVNTKTEKTGGALFKGETKNAGTCTDFTRKHLAPQDWFYSALSRRLIRRHFIANQMHMDKELNGEFINHDCENFYRDIDEPNPNHKKYKHKVREATSKLFSDSSMSSLNEMMSPSPRQDGHSALHEKHQLTEAEITYLIEIYKKKNQKWCERAVLKEVR
jgi:hypothetical protein